MEKREPRVYYIQEGSNRNAILVFDAGYASGDVHIYERKESRKVEEVEKEIKAILNTDQLSAPLNPVWLWVEKKFGHSMSWKLISEGEYNQDQ